jgi:hypothetical protein
MGMDLVPRNGQLPQAARNGYPPSSPISSPAIDKPAGLRGGPPSFRGLPLRPLPPGGGLPSPVPPRRRGELPRHVLSVPDGRRRPRGGDGKPAACGPTFRFEDGAGNRPRPLDPRGGIRKGAILPGYAGAGEKRLLGCSSLKGLLYREGAAGLRDPRLLLDLASGAGRSSPWPRGRRPQRGADHDSRHRTEQAGALISSRETRTPSPLNLRPGGGHRTLFTNFDRAEKDPAP